MSTINEKNIWMFKQNKPSLVVDDITAKYKQVDPMFIYEILLKRGIFKWLSVRRELITLKNVWKEEITKSNTKLKNIRAIRKIEKEISIKDMLSYKEEVGRLKALVKCREEIRKLCHSTRFKAPDFDRRAKYFLDTLEVKNGCMVEKSKNKKSG